MKQKKVRYNKAMRKDIMAFFRGPDIRGNGRGTVYEKVGNGGSLFLMIFLLPGRVEGAGKRKVAIDPGHQGSWVDMSAQEAAAPGSSETKAKATTGTEGRYSGVPEYDLNLRIALASEERT